MRWKKTFGLALALAIGGAAIASPAAALETGDTGQGSRPEVSIRLEDEPKLQAPVRTLVSPDTQVYRLEFPEAMERESVMEAIQEHAAWPNDNSAPELEWNFNWDSDKLLHASVSVKKLNPENGYYLLGHYRVDVNGASTAEGNVLKEEPIFDASISPRTQLWRYSTAGDRRELLDTVSDPYYFYKLDHNDRYLLGARPMQYCECDAVLPKLHALYDLQEKQLIRYPVELQANYMGKGDFVADSRGFFYQQPTEEIKALIPQSPTAYPIHVEGYVHGASISKDGKYAFLAVGAEDQEKDLKLLLYKLETKVITVLDDAIEGWVPVDLGFGRRMPISFKDDGKLVDFTLQDRSSPEIFRELRYGYTWADGSLGLLKLPVSETSWGYFSSSTDGQYRYYANDGIYRDDEKLVDSYTLSFWSEDWLYGTHRLAFMDVDMDPASRKQYNYKINLYDAESLTSATLYTGIYRYSQIVGTSEDGNWIYVTAQEPVNQVGELPVFGEQIGEDRVAVKIDGEAASSAAIYLNESKQALTHKPVSLNDFSLYLPLREILEAAGWTISWRAEDQTVIGTKKGSGSEFHLRIGSKEAEFNGRTDYITAPPVLVGDTTYFYAGTLQQLGMRLEWDGGKRVLFIEQPPESGGILLPDGTKYEGELEGQVPSGSGMRFDEKGRLLYKGEFAEGRYHGYGVLYDTQGRVVYQGMFRNGERVD